MKSLPGRVTKGCLDDMSFHDFETIRKLWYFNTIVVLLITPLLFRSNYPETFLHHWIERADPIAWPRSSPDLTPCDYTSSGYLKDFGFHEPFTAKEEIKSSVKQDNQTTDKITFNNFYKILEYRLCFVCRDRGGDYENVSN